MKLHLARHGNENTFTGYGDGYVDVNGNRHQASLMVGAAFLEPWPAQSLETLVEADFALLIPHRPQVIVIGTGRAFQFPTPAKLRLLIEARIGYEVMDTPAACRTYNILLGEGRAVVAAVIV